MFHSTTHTCTNQTHNYDIFSDVSLLCGFLHCTFKETIHILWNNTLVASTPASPNPTYWKYMTSGKLNNSYIVLYPVTIYKLAALYVISCGMLYIITPKGGQGCHLSGISGLPVESPFLSPLLFFFCLVLSLFLSCNFSVNGPFSRKLKYFLLKVRLFYIALVEQQGDGRWYVQLADMWHWYLPLCIYIAFFYFVLCPFFFLNSCL